MFLAKVKGSVVSTQKVDKMVGQKLLVVDPLRMSTCRFHHSAGHCDAKQSDGVIRSFLLE